MYHESSRANAGVASTVVAKANPMIVLRRFTFPLLQMSGLDMQVGR